MLTHEVHERQAVVGIFGRTSVFTQREPADTTVIKLHKLAIRLRALLIAELEVIAFANHLTDEVVEIGVGAARPLPIGTKLRLQLQEPHIDPHLDHFATTGCRHHAGVDFSRSDRPARQQSLDLAGFTSRWQS